MAQTKRTRQEAESDDDNDSSDVEVESSRPRRHNLVGCHASSQSYRHTLLTLELFQNKRARLANGTATPRPSANGAGDNDDEMEDVYTYTYTAPKNDLSANIELFSSDDDEENDVDDVRISEFVRRSIQNHKENMPSESGIIEEVSMKNFMCHSRLTIPLGPLINFIIGHNGSGKSAILTALTVCLGAKASVTNRAGSLKNFIKEGEDNAWVAVKLKNQGENAYQPDVFGPSIIVERHFTKAGTSSFKVKNSEGRLISTKRADLEDVSDFFALQIDNPMNVLSQDMARQFLSNSTPSDKYKFFIKGTQLEQLDRDYNLMESLLDETEARCEARQEDVAILGDKKRKAQEKQRMMERTTTIQTQINETTWMHAWAQIEEQERNLEGLDAVVRQHDNAINRAQKAADDASRLYDEEHQTHDANLGVIADFENQLMPKKDEHREAKEKSDEAREQLKNVLVVQRQIKEDTKRYQRNKTQTQSKIDAEHARIENANGPAHAQKVTELEETRAAIPELLARMEHHSGTKPQLEQAVQQAEQQVRASKAPIEQKQQELQQAETLLQSLERDKGDQTRAFPPAIHNVRRAIQNDNRFRDKPVGPMGMYISLKKPEWSTAIERTLGGSGDAFVVTNKQDQSILSEIMRRNNW